MSLRAEAVSELKVLAEQAKQKREQKNASQRRYRGERKRIGIAGGDAQTEPQQEDPKRSREGMTVKGKKSEAQCERDNETRRVRRAALRQKKLELEVLAAGSADQKDLHNREGSTMTDRARKRIHPMHNGAEPLN